MYMPGPASDGLEALEDLDAGGRVVGSGGAARVVSARLVPGTAVAPHPAPARRSGAAPRRRPAAGVIFGSVTSGLPIRRS